MTKGRRRMKRNKWGTKERSTKARWCYDDEEKEDEGEDGDVQDNDNDDCYWEDIEKWKRNVKTEKNEDKQKKR